MKHAPAHATPVTDARTTTTREATPADENPFVALLATPAPAPENPFVALLATPSNPFAAALADARREADARAAAEAERSSGSWICGCGQRGCNQGRYDEAGIWETDDRGRRTGRRLA